MFSFNSTAKAGSLVIGTPADYVIITKSDWVPALGYYVGVKTNKGYHPRVFSVEDIYANYPGADDKEKIRNFIIDAFNVWGISYVLLAGDFEYIPSGGSFYPEYDGYYTLLDGENDTYQDVYIGRLPAENYNEVQAISIKWATYNTHGWGRSNFSLTGTDLNTTPESSDLAAYNWQATGMSGEVYSPAELTQLIVDVKNAMNSGYGLINWVGHGTSNVWAVSTDFEGFYYTWSDAYDMHNGDDLSFINAMFSCLTGVFSDEYNIGKSFIKAPQGGAIGYIGANQSVYTPGPVEPFVGRFYCNIKDQYLRTGYVMPAVAFHDAQNASTITQFNLLGDPTAKMDLLPATPDSSPPQIQNIQLSNNNILPGQATNLSFNVADDDFVGEVILKITQLDAVLMEMDLTLSDGRSDNQFSYILRNFETAQAGTYQIEIFAKDISQNSINAAGPNLVVLQDTQPPQITGVSINPQPAYVNQTVNINASITDNTPSGLVDVWADITKPNSDVITVRGSDIQYFNQTEQPGIYRMVVHAVDFAGNTATPYSKNFMVLNDTLPPVISDYWISNQFCWSSNIIRITSADTPNFKIYLYALISDNAVYGSLIHAWAQITKPDSTVISLDLNWMGGSWEQAYYQTTNETDQIGTYGVVYHAQDVSGNTVQADPIFFEITGNNMPPDIIFSEEISADNTADIYAGETLSFFVEAVDPEEGDVPVSVWQWIPGSSFDSQTGEFSWTPDSGDIGIAHKVIFEATDSHPENVIIRETVTINVAFQVPPNPPTNLIATVASNSQIDLVWQDNSDNEIGFKIEKRTEGETFAEIAAVGKNITTYSDSDLITGVIYYYRVYAYNLAGNSGYSNEETFVIYPTGPTVWYVDNSVSTSGNGKSWETAFKYLQDALDAASAGDEIWVATATQPYYPSKRAIPSDPRSATFQLIDGVALYGGFPNGGGVWEERDIATYETILSGDLLGNDGHPPDFANYNDNSYTVVTGPDGGTIETVIDGFTIRGGHAGDDFWYGGGMLNLRAPLLTIRNCIFKENYAYSSDDRPFYGGAIDNINAGISNPNRSPNIIKIIDCLFVNNAGCGGGAIFNYGSSPIEVTNCVFTGNGGGAIYTIGSKNNPPKLTNCTFYNNLNYGIVIYQSNPIITNCIFWDNGIEIYNGIFSNKPYTLCNPAVTYSDIKGGYEGEGNINAAPLFVNPNNPAGEDGILRTGDDGLRVRINSPCIDAANGDIAPLTDILGLERIDIDEVPNTGTGTLNYVDIGAYESGHD